MIRGRHPSDVSLMAWHDGELEGDEAAPITAHIEGCERCWTRAADFAAVDRVVSKASLLGAFQAADVPAFASPAPRSPSRVGRVMASAVVAVLVVATAVTLDLPRSRPVQAIRAAISSPERDADSAPPAKTTAREAALAADGPARVPAAPPAQASAHVGADEMGSASVDASAVQGAGGSRTGVVPVPRVPVRTEPLRMALPLPLTTGELGERQEIIDAVDAVVDAANASGGVAGLPVRFDVVRPDRLDDTSDRYEVVVGGVTSFGAAASSSTVPWVLPAVASTGEGPLIPPTPAPASAAAALVATLPADASVAIIDGDVAEKPFADAITAALGARAKRVALDGRTGCAPELRNAARMGASALVLAMRPSYAHDCLDALGGVTWNVSGGVIVPASMAFEPPTRSHAKRASIRIALGLPWPTWDDPASARFRQAARSTSYRAMVSFAAAELAILAARRSAGPLTYGAVAGDTDTDALALRGGTLARLHVAEAAAGGWSRYSAG